jgi:hypothetical protein
MPPHPTRHTRAHTHTHTHARTRTHTRTHYTLSLAHTHTLSLSHTRARTHERMQGTSHSLIPSTVLAGVRDHMTFKPYTAPLECSFRNVIFFTGTHTSQVHTHTHTHWVLKSSGPGVGVGCSNWHVVFNINISTTGNIVSHCLDPVEKISSTNPSSSFSTQQCIDGKNKAKLSYTWQPDVIAQVLVGTDTCTCNATGTSTGTVTGAGTGTGTGTGTMRGGGSIEGWWA